MFACNIIDISKMAYITYIGLYYKKYYDDCLTFVGLKCGKVEVK